MNKTLLLSTCKFAVFSFNFFVSSTCKNLGTVQSASCSSPWCFNRLNLRESSDCKFSPLPFGYRRKEISKSKILSVVLLQAIKNSIDNCIQSKDITVSVVFKSEKKPTFTNDSKKHYTLDKTTLWYVFSSFWVESSRRDLMSTDGDRLSRNRRVVTIYPSEIMR